MTSSARLRFFTTAVHGCSYLPHERAQTLFVDPDSEMNTAVFSELSEAGFRRSGHYVYRPRCGGCQACESVRIVLADFQLNRSFRRVRARNHDLHIHLTHSDWHAEHYDLYERYLATRHRDGDMYPPSPRQYREFLLCDWSDTTLIEFRLEQRLVAVAVTDRLRDGLSAVYTFYDTDLTDRSLGTFAILTQIDWAQQLNLPYLYLGYWIEASPRMTYKTRFQPLEHYRHGQWLQP